MGKTKLKVPLLEDIRVGGKIALLVQRPQKSYDCHECKGVIETGEPHYSVTWAGAGLGSIKFPSRVCAGCIYQHLGIKKAWRERFEEWSSLLDWCTDNREELEAAGRTRGLTLCLQKIWTVSRP